jgi:hypothetical protein
LYKCEASLCGYAKGIVFEMPSFSDIFEWSGWDDMGQKLFYECVLLRDVGSFKSGHYFDYVSFDDENFKVRFYEKFGDDTPVMVKTMGLVD